VIAQEIGPGSTLLWANIRPAEIKDGEERMNKIGGACIGSNGAGFLE
jgi:hypothetical protein